MTNPFGGFTAEALEAYQKALAEQAGTDFAEGDSYDFTTCIRPDGSAYGTGGQCRKGSEGDSKSKEGHPKKFSPEQRKVIAERGAKAAKKLKETKKPKEPSKKPEQSVIDKAMEMVRAKMKARGQTEIKRGESKPAAPVSTEKKPYPKGYDWRKQSGTFNKADNE
jgi:hypothetical protein